MEDLSYCDEFALADDLAVGQGFLRKAFRGPKLRLAQGTAVNVELFESSIDLIDYSDARNRNISLLCIATGPI
ncbi:hypothetical protein [Qipengyuania mesophila]|uniref:hypothetical protein n=1 Tax=Qipengyuania mesophila TaxID=2867246 RepID=UPI00355A1AC9